MRCLFCKQDSFDSNSVEHIIPESLGNTTAILPKGMVCDKCNNYFARKVEKPFLETSAIKALRFREAIPSKKGVVPYLNGVLSDGSQVKVINPFPGLPLFGQSSNPIVAIETEHSNITKLLQKGTIITPAFVDEMIPKNTILLSRFIAKIALESLALRFSEIDGGVDYLIDNSDFDPIRDYARRGSKKEWSCNIRRIYEIDKLWQDNTGEPYQTMHESDFLLIPVDENTDMLHDYPVIAYPFFVFALFGLEFAICMSDPALEGLDIYEGWLQKHGNISPLYYGKNEN